MKILTISNLYPPHLVGGYEVRCQQVMDRLKGRGHEVLVLTSNHHKDGIPLEEESSVLRRLRIHGFFGHPWLSMRALYQLEKHNHRILHETIADFNPDIIHVWNMGGLSKSLLHRIESGTKPIVYDVSDHWIARSLKADVWLSWWNRPAHGLSGIIRRCATALGIKSLLSSQVPTDSWQFLTWQNIYFCSEFLKNLTLQAGYPVQHGDVIYCGVETGSFTHKKSFENFSKLLFVGRLSEDKDPLTAIRGVAIARERGHDVTLDLYGKGDDQYVSQLKHTVNELGLKEHVHFCSTTPEAMRAIYAEYDALLFTSNWGEPFALTPLEAMSAHLPVILCPDGGDAELGRDRENCIVAETANPESIADGIETLAQDLSLREKIATSAGKEVTEYYDLEIISGQIEAYLMKVLDDAE